MSGTRTKIAKYIMLPGIIPMMAELFTSGFSHVAYFMALIYQSVGLLPRDHPYINPANRGRYGIRHVMAQAANNLVISKKNIDQVFVFTVLLVGIVMLMLQIILVGFAFVAEHQVMAQNQPPSLRGADMVRNLLFVTSDYGHGSIGEEQDLAFILMDRIFGTQGIFNSCVADAAASCVDLGNNVVPTPGTYPFPIHTAFHFLIRFYSIGIFMVSVMVIIYFAITIVAEMAASGTPFGQRTNKVWAPIRLIVFFALLVPLNIGDKNEGFNAAQIITFWVAKTGSNFATNAWGRFNTQITSTYMGEVDKLIAKPEIPEFKSLVQFMFVAKACKMMTEYAYPEELSTGNGTLDKGIQAYLVRPPLSGKAMPGSNSLDANTTNFDTAFKHADYGHITIRFGARDTRPAGQQFEQYKDQWGYVFPHCGDVRVSVDDLDVGRATTSGSLKIYEQYYNMVLDMWNDVTLTEYARCLAVKSDSGLGTQSCSSKAEAVFFKDLHEKYRSRFAQILPQLITQKTNNGEWAVSAELRRKGWAGAAIWYNEVARMNGDVTSAVFAVPTVVQYPSVMKVVAEAKLAANPDTPQNTLFAPSVSDTYDIAHLNEEDTDIALVLSNVFSAAAQFTVSGDSFSTQTGNGFIDSINWLFGTSGIYEIRDNPDIHPLAQLSALGKSMMEASVRNFGLGLMGGVAKHPLEGVPKQFATIGQSFFQTISVATLAMSFAMYTVLPLMPFIYFFFAVSGWVKSIFEAIVGMPLWALAHLRVDGEGLPGQAGANGYYLLLEIFLRPILIVFGLLAAINIFSSLVLVLNDTYDVVVANVGGFDVERGTQPGSQSVASLMRNPLDEFMFTVMYVIITFMIGQSCFKLINLVPQRILRWAGTNVQAFQETAGDPASQTMQMTYQGIKVGTGQLSGGALALLSR